MTSAAWAYRRAKIYLLVLRAKAFVIKYIDIAFILFLIMLLSDYHHYYKHVKYDGKTWWSWAMYDNWNIEGKLPIYGDIKDASSPAGIALEEVVDQGLVKFSSNRPILRDKNVKEQDDMRLIVFSFPPFNERAHHKLDPNLCGGKCMVSYDTKLRDRADAVIFHFSEKFPNTRRSFPSQLFVWMNQESPSTTYYNRDMVLKEYDNVFNLTMTYRRDSSIYYPYKTAHEIRDEIRRDSSVEDLPSLFESKIKLIAWASGNCVYTKGAGARMKMILLLLGQGLELDMYGACSLRYLPGFWWDLPQHLSKYKFYFSFENALHCRDYITEKSWWNAIRSGAVPVIWGPMREEVEAVLPEGSFIFLEDFKSPKDLVNYLHYLDKNMDVYAEYFKWRFHPLRMRIPGRLGGNHAWLNSRITGLCQLCHVIHDDARYEKENGSRPRRVVPSLFSWWYLKETKTCLTPRSTWELAESYWLAQQVFNQVTFKSLTYAPAYILSYIIILSLLFARRFKMLRQSR